MSQTKATTPGSVPVRLETATKLELIAQYNAQADAIRSVNAAITMTLTAGSAYSGMIKQYHEVSGFLLARRPSRIRVIGQLPVVGTNIFDMESDGDTFRIFIPPQNKFVTGPAVLERPSDQPIENLRPQHLLDAIFWQPIPQAGAVLFEEASDGSAQYYVLTLVDTRAMASSDTGPAASPGWEITRKIWFDRSDLHIARLTTYDAGGKIASDIRYSQWGASGAVKYAHQVVLARPENDYTLEIGITKVTFNEDIADDRFVLNQPPGVEVVHVGDDSVPTKSDSLPGGKP
jgi:outer membrane lipoprotein-sorting protein